MDITRSFWDAHASDLLTGTVTDIEHYRIHGRWNKRPFGHGRGHSMVVLTAYNLSDPLDVLDIYISFRPRHPETAEICAILPYPEGRQ